MLVAVRLRGTAKPGIQAADTLTMLNLKRANHCTLVADNPTNRGMLEKVKNYLTYGDASDETIKTMISKRGRKAGDVKLSEKEAAELAKIVAKSQTLRDSGIKPYFRLSPPSGGFKSIKRLYPRGDCGYRGDAINKLLERMI